MTSSPKVNSAWWGVLTRRVVRFPAWPGYHVWGRGINYEGFSYLISVERFSARAKNGLRSLYYEALNVKLFIFLYKHLDHNYGLGN